MKTSYANTTHKTKNIVHKQNYITYEVQQAFIFSEENKLFISTVFNNSFVIRRKCVTMEITLE